MTGHSKMSINFCIQHGDQSETLNFSNANAWALLEWIGIQPDHGGCILARDLAAKIRRRMWPSRNQGDEAVAAIVEIAEGRCTAIDFGRRAGYFHERGAQLLHLAERAGDGFIGWG
jgi:hypothetical protein